MGKSRLKALTSQIKDIKHQLNRNEKISVLAKKYNVSATTIRRLKSNKENELQHSTQHRESTRKRQNNLNMLQKQEIIKHLAAGVSIQQLASNYNVAVCTIRRIKNKEDEITKRVQVLKEVNGSMDRKKMHGLEEDPLDQAVYAWFLQQRSLGDPISGDILREKALDLNKIMNGPEKFKASNGWLHNLKKRHGIRQLSMEGEKLSSDKAAADSFFGTFTNLLEEQGYDLNQVYNADETGLYYKSLPKKTLAAGCERQASGCKEMKDRATVMFCANASGSHKISLLLIGKSKKPRCFNGIDVDKLPAKYTNQKSAWMDKHLFYNWYVNVFIPEVAEKHPDMPEKPRKVLLLLDNAPSHPSASELNQIDSSIQVMYLPPNVTALIQPMDQGIIEKTKKMYRKQLLKELILHQQYEGSIIDLAKKQTMKDCCYRIANAWNTVTAKDVRNSWKNLLGKDSSHYQKRNLDEDVHQVLSIIKGIPEYSDCTFETAKLWVEEDYQETGWEVLDIERILERILQGDFSQVDDCENFDITDPESSYTEPEPMAPKIEEAFAGLTTFRAWFEERFESTKEHLINIQELVDLTLNIANPI